MTQNDSIGIGSAVLWTVVILAVAFGIYFYGVLHSLLGVRMSSLVLPW